MPHMPTYERFCETNGQTAGISHRMSELLGAWAELCQQSGIASGQISARRPIRRLISAAARLTGKGLRAATQAANGHARTACCGGCAWPA